MKKKVFAVLLTICMILGIIPLQAFADAETQEITVSVTGKTSVGEKLAADLSKLEDTKNAVIQWQKKDNDAEDSKAKDVGMGTETLTLGKEDVGSVFRIIVKENEDTETSLQSGWTKAVKAEEKKGKETEVSETQGTEVPENEASATEAPETEAQMEAPETKAPETQAPETEAPVTEAPVTEAPETEAPETKAPETDAPETQAPETGGADNLDDKMYNQGSNRDGEAITVDMAQVDFGSVVAGYTAPEAKLVTITNTGSAQVTLDQPTAANYVLGTLSATVLEMGENATFTIQPKTELAANGNYEEDITITGSGSVSTMVKLKFTVNAPVYSIVANTSSIEFASMPQGYTAPDAKTITIENTGNSKVNLSQPTATNYVIGALTATELAGGQTTTFTIQPKAGLAKGTYEENITISGDNNTSAVVKAKFVVTDAPTYTISANTSKLVFSSSEVGYTSGPAAQTVEITNTGNSTITLIQPTAFSFNIGNLSATEVSPGNKATFTVQPKQGLEAGSYEDTIEVKTSQGSIAQVKALFSVTDKAKAENSIVSIVKPDAVTAKNGTPKLADSLGLPSTVKIVTTQGTEKAKVSWNVADADYNKTSTEKQKFTVTGKVTLPDGVANTDDISLKTTIGVTVKAYEPKVPKTSKNIITGIEEGNSFKTNTEITFQAIGGGMDNDSPKKGDVRYKPVYWTIDHQNKFSNDSYKGTFKILSAGTYTLKVTYDRQVYNGKNWESDETTDTTSVTFKITGKTVSNIKGKTAVKTGDDSPVLMLAIVCGICVICIGGIIIFQKRKKKN